MFTIEVLVRMQSNTEAWMLVIEFIFWMLNVSYEILISFEMQWLNIKHILHVSYLRKWISWIFLFLFVFEARLPFPFTKCGLMIMFYKVRHLGLSIEETTHGIVEFS
jgi:uncharacterized membrane protein (DUF485 family)